MEVDSFSDLLPRLTGKVFHVTLASSFSEIVASGRLVANEGGRESPFGNTVNGYFRFKGCVSFFDYRRAGSPEWEEHYCKCVPTQPLTSERPIVVLFLAEGEHRRLLSWEGWKQEQLWSYRVVPHIECGYPGSIELTKMEGALYVRKKLPPSSVAGGVG